MADPGLGGEPMSGREIAAAVASLLRAHYVFPDRAEQAAAAIEASLAAGEYDDLDEISLAERLTGQMHESCADKHLRLRVAGQRRLAEPADPGAPGPGLGPAPGSGPAADSGPAPGPGPGPGEPGPADRERARLARREQGRLDNFGIARVERLDGNVGYLDLRRMPDPANAGPAIAAAMELVAGTYALIIDLRRNGGGMPEGVIFWCSYLFPDADTHLNDIFDAETGLTRQFWSLAYVPGRRYLDRPVYVLTSEHTFSGAEELCYNLQAQGRAKLIGETTGGGAHPTRMLPVGPGVVIAMPHARSVNPVTGTNWEGTGVVPDVAVPAAAAFDEAYRRALRHVLSADVPPPVEAAARDALTALPATPAAGQV